MSDLDKYREQLRNLKPDERWVNSIAEEELAVRDGFKPIWDPRLSNERMLLSEDISAEDLSTVMGHSNIL